MDIANLFRIQKEFMIKGIRRDIVFKMTFITNILTDFVFNYLKIVFLEVLYLYGKVEIAGFTLDEMKFLFGCSFIIISLYMLFVFFGHIYLPNKIQNRTLDYVLLKPMPIILNISFNRFNIAGIGSTLYGLYLIINSVGKINITFDALNIAVFLLNIVIGFIIYSSLSLILYTISFWSLKADGIIGIIAVMGDFTKYPHKIYPIGIQFFLSFVFPVLFACTYPVENQLLNLNIYYLILNLLVMVIILCISNLFLKRGLLKYNN